MYRDFHKSSEKLYSFVLCFVSQCSICRLEHFVPNTSRTSTSLLGCATITLLLRSLLMSYQKKNWRAGPHQSFFWYDTDYRFIICSPHRVYMVYSQCHTKRRIGGALPANPSFDKDLKKCFCGTRHIL